MPGEGQGARGPEPLSAAAGRSNASREQLEHRDPLLLRQEARPRGHAPVHALVEAGLSREDAYVVVQRNAMQAWETGEHLRDLVLADPDAQQLDAAVIDTAFSLDEVLASTEIPFGRLAQ